MRQRILPTTPLRRLISESLVRSATTIAADVISGRRTAVAELAATLAVHASTHARLNALTQPRPEAAEREAAALDRRLAETSGGKTALPLAGVPISVKECFPVAGLRTTLGIPARADATDAADAWLVTRVRDAGGIIVGKVHAHQAMFLH